MKEILPLDKSVLVFVHIKKTAGISLQTKLFLQYGDKFFGGTEHSVLRNIGAKNSLEKEGLTSLPDGSCVCKHWPISDYEPIKDRCNFITVLREPISRVISHYNFYRTFHKQDGISIDEYIRDPLNINVYQQMLSRPEWLSEIYLFEDMKASTKRSRLIRYRELPRLNKTRYRYAFTESQMKDVERLNTADIEMYRQVRASHGLS